MAHHKSARKRIRRNQRRADMNGGRISRIRTFVRHVEEAVAGRDQEAARAALRAAQPEVMRGVNKGALHRNFAARTIARLAVRVNALG